MLVRKHFSRNVEALLLGTMELILPFYGGQTNVFWVRLPSCSLGN